MDEFRPNDFLAVDGFHSPLRVSSLRGPLPRSLQGQELLVLGLVLDYGFCPADLSREPQRYRGLSAHDAPRSFITWAFAVKSLATLWPTPIRCEIGKSTPTSPKR